MISNDSASTGALASSHPAGAVNCIEPVLARIVSGLTVRQAASCRLVKQSWRDAIDTHGALAYGSRANGHRVSLLQWRNAISGVHQQTWQHVARALSERKPSWGGSFAKCTEVHASYVVNSPEELRASMQRRTLPQQPQLNVDVGLDMALKLQRYWACRMLDSAAYRMQENFIALLARSLLELSSQPLPLGFTDAPALRGAMALPGTSRIDSYGRRAGPRRAVGAFVLDRRLALDSEYAAPVMVGLGSDGTSYRPNLTMVLVAENEARTAQRYFRIQAGRDAGGQLQIDQPSPFGPDGGFAQGTKNGQTWLPQPIFWTTVTLEVLHNHWPEGRKAAHRRRAGSYFVELLAGARIEYLDDVMPDDEQQVRPWFGELAPARSRQALPCGYRLARSDELPLIQWAKANAPQAR